jgi:hypothetical protein
MGPSKRRFGVLRGIWHERFGLASYLRQEPLSQVKDAQTAGQGAEMAGKSKIGLFDLKTYFT